MFHGNRFAREGPASRCFPLRIPGRVLILSAMNVRALLVTALLVSLLAGVAAAADDAPAAPPPRILKIEYGQEDLTGEVGVVSGSGRIHIRQGDFELLIEDGGVVLWVDPDGYRKFRPGAGSSGGGEAAEVGDILGPVIHELYAEGGVTLRRDGMEVRAERMFFNFQRNRAVVIEADVTVQVGEVPRVPIRVRAERLYQLAKDEFVAGSARLTTCLYGEPHYELTVKKIHVRRHGEDDATVRTSGNLLRAGDLPVFWVPFTFASVKGGIEPVRDIFAGNSSKYGPLVGVELGGGLRFGEGEDEIRWGEWSVTTLYRSRRGPGLGGRLTYDQSGATGSLIGFYQRDRQSKDHISGDPIPREDRGRVRWQHRQAVSDDFLDGKLTAIAELSWLSDRGFLPEYYPREFRQDKAQETVAYADWKSGRHAVSLTGRWQANEFQTQTEYLPRLDYDVVDFALVPDVLGVGDLTFSGEAEATRIRRKFDHRLTTRGEDTDRVGARGTLALPATLGIFRLAPEFGGGVTTYSGSQFAGRADMHYALRAATDLWRVYPDVESNLLDLHGLRHVVRLSAGYVDRFRVSRPSDRLFVQDPEDLLDEVRAVDVILRNRLETKRAGAIVEFLDLELRGIFFPDRMDARPAPFDAREEFGLGTSSMLLPGEEKWRSIPRHGMGPVTAHARSQLRDSLALIGDVWYDFETHHFETWAAAVQYEAFPDLGIYLGHRAIRGDSSVITASVDFVISDRWSAQVFHQADLRGGGTLLTGLNLRRRYHDFLISFEFRHNETERETSFAVTVEPGFLFDAKRRPGGIATVDYTAPRWYR